MASRWRTWDAHFATDILGNQLPFDTFDSLPVGTRGRFKFNIPPNLLVIPTIAIEKSDVKVGGRGRRLREQNLNQVKEILPKVGFKEKSDEYYRELRQETHKKEWPSLPTSATTKVTNKNNDNSVANVQKHFVTYDAQELSYSQFQDAEQLEKVDTNVFGEDSKESEKLVEEVKSCSDFEKREETKSYSDVEENKAYSDIEENKENCKEKNANETLFDMSEQSFTTNEFLTSLENPESYILIENLTQEADEEDFKELITSFGEITLFLTQPCSDGIHKNVLVKMSDESQCVWVISCLDGDIYEEDGERIVARAVDDIL